MLFNHHELVTIHEQRVKEMQEQARTDNLIQRIRAASPQPSLFTSAISRVTDIFAMRREDEECRDYTPADVC